jgi:hypothetical protein
LKDLEFSISLIRVFLGAAFPSEGNISEAVKFVRKSSSIQDVEGTAATVADKQDQKVD